mmetsp:Transcript_104011/g.184404  ORF Transcript_104011/g.184404 Transcript_104011/m.184404 type:complete len:230 (+) Transcript_104011:43-732(+)
MVGRRNLDFVPPSSRMQCVRVCYIGELNFSGAGTLHGSALFTSSLLESKGRLLSKPLPVQAVRGRSEAGGASACGHSGVAVPKRGAPGVPWPECSIRSKLKHLMGVFTLGGVLHASTLNALILLRSWFPMLAMRSFINCSSLRSALSAAGDCTCHVAIESLLLCAGTEDDGSAKDTCPAALGVCSDSKLPASGAAGTPALSTIVDRHLRCKSAASASKSSKRFARDLSK